MNIEEFVNDYLQEHRHEVLLNPYNGLIDFANAFKNKIKTEAVEGEVLQVTKNRIPFVMLNLDAAKYKDGDKVRVIVLPKED